MKKFSILALMLLTFSMSFALYQNFTVARHDIPARWTISISSSSYCPKICEITFNNDGEDIASAVIDQNNLAELKPENIHILDEALRSAGVQESFQNILPQALVLSGSGASSWVIEISESEPGVPCPTLCHISFKLEGHEIGNAVIDQHDLSNLSRKNVNILKENLDRAGIKTPLKEIIGNAIIHSNLPAVTQ